MRSLSRRDSTSIWPVCVSITGRRTGKRSGFSGSFLRGSTSGSCSGDMYSPLESHFMPGYLRQQQQAPHHQGRASRVHKWGSKTEVFVAVHALCHGSLSAPNSAKDNYTSRTRIGNT